MGCFLPENETRDNEGENNNVVAAIKAINDSGRCLFMLAIMSGKPEAAEYVYREIIGAYVNQSEVIEETST